MATLTQSEKEWLCDVVTRITDSGTPERKKIRDILYDSINKNGNPDLTTQQLDLLLNLCANTRMILKGKIATLLDEKRKGFPTVTHNIRRTR